MTPRIQRRGRRSREQSARRHVLLALGGAVVALAITYWAFFKSVPFKDHYEVHATFATANQLRPGSLVRVAGVTVGKVVAINAGSRHTSRVTMRIEREDLLRRSATFAIEPRLVLEGNFHVAVSPGSAGPRLRSGDTVPLAQTSAPVQLDQVISSLSRPVRDALVQGVGDLAEGLGSTHGRPSGASGLRRAAHELRTALKPARQVARALQGTQTGDLSRAVASTAATARQLSTDPLALAGLVSSYERVLAAAASEDRSVAATVAATDRLLRNAPPALRRLDAAVPEVVRVAREIRPTLARAPSTLGSVNRMLAQLSAASSEGELPALLRHLRPTTRGLPSLERQLARSLPLLSRLGSCLSKVVVPTFDQEIKDGVNSTRRPAWQDFLHLGASLAGASPSFDGNGTTIRLGLTESEVATVGEMPSFGKFAGGGEIEGVNPTWLGYGVNPPSRPDAWCDEQRVPQLNTRAGPAPAELRSEKIGQPVMTARVRRLVRALADAPGGPARRRILRELLDALPRPARQARPARRPDRSPARSPGIKPVAGEPRRPSVEGVREIVGKTLAPLTRTPEDGSSTVRGLIDGLLGERP